MLKVNSYWFKSLETDSADLLARSLVRGESNSATHTKGQATS